MPQNFLRIHKSFIVNKNRIQSYNNDSVEIDSRILPIGSLLTKTFLPYNTHRKKVNM
ncbi:LytTR family transcriptional regulator DNA-binding domain-containing protein [Eudoraea sp.]|uniref:LytTR family transcriptional regulator DNA-binding domain-containing protein n=1 Tax=Eudoraea sp. TaxID=1979955 RepID=UPI003C744FAA